MKTNIHLSAHAGGTLDITYDEYEQKVIWKLKINASGVFKIRLSNIWPGVWDSIYHHHLQKPHVSKGRQTLGENGTRRV